MPDAVGGLTNSFSYKNWELNVLFVYSIGGQVYDSSSKRQLGVVSDWNMRTELFDRWREPGDEAMYPRLTRDPGVYGSNTPWINTDMWLHDADYLRLRNLTVGYNIPKSSLNRFGIDRMRVSFIATNLFVITNLINLKLTIMIYKKLPLLAVVALFFTSFTSWSLNQQRSRDTLSFKYTYFMLDKSEERYYSAIIASCIICWISVRIFSFTSPLFSMLG